MNLPQVVSRAEWGRQEDWEDSPEGYAQTSPYVWWRRHDEYDDLKG